MKYILGIILTLDFPLLFLYAVETFGQPDTAVCRANNFCLLKDGIYVFKLRPHSAIIKLQ